MHHQDEKARLAVDRLRHKVETTPARYPGSKTLKIGYPASVSIDQTDGAAILTLIAEQEAENARLRQEVANLKEQLSYAPSGIDQIEMGARIGGFAD